MDRADEELKETVKHLWPLQSIKKLDLVVPPKECNYNLKLKRILRRSKISYNSMALITTSVFIPV